MRLEAEPQIGGGQETGGFVRPFHQTDRILAEVLVQAGIEKFLRRTEAIKIKVIQV